MDVNKQAMMQKAAEEYDKACQEAHINNPIAYALYKAWKFFDKNDKETKKFMSEMNRIWG